MTSLSVEFDEFINDLKESYDTLKDKIEKDLVIDETDLDSESLSTPKLHARYMNIFSDEMIQLKSFYNMKEQIKLERWKFYMGKQTSEYYANEKQHEKILKTDVDKYMAADWKMEKVDKIVSIQKQKVDILERTLKEIGNRGFHIKTAADWRRFTAGER